MSTTQVSNIKNVDNTSEQFSRFCQQHCEHQDIFFVVADVNVTGDKTAPNSYSRHVEGKCQVFFTSLVSTVRVQCSPVLLH